MQKFKKLRNLDVSVGSQQKVGALALKDERAGYF
jgi:hypothetical protein